MSVPADESVGVGRASDASINPEIEKVEKTMAKDNVVDAAEVERQVRADLAAEHQTAIDAAVEARASEVSDIMELGARKNMSDKAREYVQAGKTIGEFRGYVLDNMSEGDAPLVENKIGMNEKETERFSIMRLVRAKVGGRAEVEAARFEIEACEAASEAMGSSHKTRGFRIPEDVMQTWMQRDLNTTDDADLIPTEHRAGSFVDALRNASSVMQAGATRLTGLEGNVDIPAKNAVSSATWISAEGGNSTESEPTFRNIALTPNDLSVFTDMTRRMRQQSSPDIEMLVRSDITMAIALGLDLAGLEGTGAAGQPTGVLNTAGVNAPTSFAAVNPTFAEVVAMETAIADDNALMGSLAYIGRTNMYGALKTTAKDAGSGQFVVEPGGTVNGYQYIRSNQGTDGNLYFGNWSDLLLGFWGGLDLVVDEAALALSNGLRLLAFQTMDVNVRHAESFAFNNDGV